MCSKYISFLILSFSHIICDGFPLEDCPCSNKDLCKPLEIAEKRKEILIFSTDSSNFRKYDLDKITTIAVFGEFNTDLLCTAHDKNIRVVLKADIPYDQLENDTQREIWIKDQMDLVEKQWADGINIDVEYPIEFGSSQYYALTDWVARVTDSFHQKWPYSQVTFDVAWSPDCIDGRCYDYSGLAMSTDFLVIMSYDEQSQMKTSTCVAQANSPIVQTIQGIKRYIRNIGTTSEKLVVGLPWYGYDYPCLKVEYNRCDIPLKPFRGVNCSDAAGRQYCYRDIVNNFLPRAIGGVQWDYYADSPFFNYKGDDGRMHQIWYDNPKSLGTKYAAAMIDYDLRGIAIWNGDCALTDTQFEAEMWRTLPRFK